MNVRQSHCHQVSVIAFFFLLDSCRNPNIAGAPHLPKQEDKVIIVILLSPGMEFSSYLLVFYKNALISKDKINLSKICENPIDPPANVLDTNEKDIKTKKKHESTFFLQMFYLTPNRFRNRTKDL